MDRQKVPLLSCGDPAISQACRHLQGRRDVPMATSFLIIRGGKESSRYERKNLVLRDAKLHPAGVRQRCRKGLK